MTIGSSISAIQPKTIAAVVLVAVMGVLWARVLLRSGPDTASAATSEAQQTQQDNTPPEVKIRAIPLAVIAGRHDTIADDFFNAARCSAWNQNTKTSPVILTPSSNENQRTFGELVKAVSLEAIIKDAGGNAEKACINGVIVKAGSVLQIAVRNETYSVRIVAIEPGRVRLNWQDRSIDIEMPDQKVN